MSTVWFSAPAELCKHNYFFAKPPPFPMKPQMKALPDGQLVSCDHCACHIGPHCFLLPAYLTFTVSCSFSVTLLCNRQWDGHHPHHYCTTDCSGSSIRPKRNKILRTYGEWTEAATVPAMVISLLLAPTRERVKLAAALPLRALQTYSQLQVPSQNSVCGSKNN